MSNSEKRNFVYGLLGLLSILSVSLGYVYGHKPFTPTVLMGISHAVWQMLSASAVILLGAGLGERILHRWQIEGLERLVVAVALGLGGLSLILLTLGLTVGYSLWISAPLFIAAFFALRKYILRCFSPFREIKIADGFEKAIAICIAILIVYAGFSALAPPVKFDALVYHLTLPQMYLDAGRFIYIPEMTYWGMPQLTEMNYLLAMQLGGLESAAALGLFIGLAALAGIFGVVKNSFGGKAAWVSVAALLAGGTLSGSLSWAYVDWTSALFGSAALAALIHWLKNEDRASLLVIGALSGFALSVKYTNGVLLLAVLFALLAWSKKDLRGKLMDVFLAGAMAVAVSLPWWIKNATFTGNPFYPLFFEAGEIDATRLFFFRSEVPHAGLWQWLSAFLLPIHATVYGIEGADGFSASIGPILLAFSVLAWMGWNECSSEQQNVIRASAALTLVGMTLWAVGSRFSGLLIQTRLFYAIFPAWAVLAGAGFSAIWKRNFNTIRLGRMAGVLAVFMLGLNSFHSLLLLTANNPAAVVLRLVSPQNYLARNLGSYTAAMDSVNRLPEESRVVMLWEARGYHCLPRCDSDEVIDRWVSDLRREGNPRAVLASWKNKGYTHVLIHELGAEFVEEHDARIRADEWQALLLLRNSLREQEKIGGSYTLYEIP